jgi:hypothetical protein
VSRELSATNPVVRFYSDGSRVIRPEAPALDAADSVSLLAQLERKIAPLRITRTAARAGTINLLISSIEQQVRFAGVSAVVDLAARLADEGHHARIVVLDDRPATDMHLPGGVELFDATDRRSPLEVSDEDRFVATSVWSAHVASRAADELGGPCIVFVIQEDEQLFYPSGSYLALAEQAYRLPHMALFSTELLRDWFRLQRRGVFSAGVDVAQELVFRNAMVDPGKLNPAMLRTRSPHGLLFYARSGSTEARNLFELALLGLRQAISDGVFVGDWRFTGVGAPQEEILTLPDGSALHLHPRQDRGLYRAMLRGHDVGLALMHSPHPSMVPIEMAAAGMVTVTSLFGNKDAQSLTSISPNIRGCEPTVDGVAAALRLAVDATAAIDARIRGAEIDWPTSAQTAFPPELIAQVSEQLSR